MSNLFSEGFSSIGAGSMYLERISLEILIMLQIPYNLCHIARPPRIAAPHSELLVHPLGGLRSNPSMGALSDEIGFELGQRSEAGMKVDALGCF